MRLFFYLILLLPASVNADTWALPSIKKYHSQNERYVFTIIPRSLESQLAYFQDLVDGKKEAGQRHGEIDKARGILELTKENGASEKIWEILLVNDVSPVRALVTDDGSYVVTFDNWHSAGYGEDAIVIYDREGTVVRMFSVKSVIGEEHFSGLPRSVSSIHWGGEHALSADQSELELEIAKAFSNYRDIEYISKRIRLIDGVIIE